MEEDAVNRLIIEAIAALALLGAFWWWSAHERAVGERKVIAAVEQERKTERARTDKLKEETDRDWQAKLDGLQVRVDTIRAQPSAPIRLCKPAGEVRVSKPAAIVDAATEGPGPAVSSGPDISGAILVYAAQCERDRKQVIGLQEWIKGVSAR